MNFFGHASVACWLDVEPRWVLGAMLPDFASMSRARLRGADDPQVRAGIALHHATDGAFHNAPVFVDLYASGGAALEAAGLDRGPSRAVAHVGTELLLDGLLLDRDGAARDAYLAAVALPLSELGLRFARDDGPERFALLYERLSGYGLPFDYRSPEQVALRLEQILARRPRLAIRAGDRAIILPFLERTREALAASLPDLLDEVRAGLATYGAVER